VPETVILRYAAFEDAHILPAGSAFQSAERLCWQAWTACRNDHL